MRKTVTALIIICFSFSLSYANEIEKIVIFGAGPAGLTSALFAGQSHLNPLVVEGNPCEGQLTSIYRIENFPGFPEGISGLELNERLREQALIFGARFHSSCPIEVDLAIRPFHITLEDGSEIYTESLVIATGNSIKWLGLESEEALVGKGISANAIVDGPEFKDKEVIVVGGGDSALEQALILTQYASRVTIIYKRDAFYASKYLQERVSKNQKIKPLLNTDIIDIQDVTQDKVTSVILQNVLSEQEFKFACDGIFISNGRQPNTQIFKNQLEMTSEGYIITKPDTTLTSVPGVFAAGDITQNSYRKVVAATASGCMSAIDAGRFLQNK